MQHNIESPVFPPLTPAFLNSPISKFPHLNQALKLHEGVAVHACATVLVAVPAFLQDHLLFPDTQVPLTG
jgi:hypothetical protein